MWEKVQNILSGAEADNKTTHTLKISITMKSEKKNCLKCTKILTMVLDRGDKMIRDLNFLLCFPVCLFVFLVLFPTF